MYSTEEWKRDNGVADSDLTTIYQAPADDDKDKGKKVTSPEIPLNQLSPFAMAKLGKAVPIKTSYSKEEISTVVSIGAMFGLEFVGAGELSPWHGVLT